MTLIVVGKDAVEEGIFVAGGSAGLDVVVVVVDCDDFDVEDEVLEEGVTVVVVEVTK